MSEQPRREPIPIHYPGYRPCAECGYMFYSKQPAHREVKCKICRTENIYTWKRKPKKPAKEKKA